MPTANLTDRKIDSLKPEKELVEWWDTKTPGFGIRISPRGKKTWFVMYRVRGKKAAHDCGVIWRDEMFKDLGSARDAFPLDTYHVLNRDDHARQSACVPFGEFSIYRSCLLK